MVPDNEASISSGEGKYSPLPLALVGGFWLLYVLGYNLSIAVAVGFIALGGVAVEIDDERVGHGGESPGVGDGRVIRRPGKAGAVPRASPPSGRRTNTNACVPSRTTAAGGTALDAVTRPRL